MLMDIRAKIYNFIRGNQAAWAEMQTSNNPKYLTKRGFLSRWYYNQHFAGSLTIAIYPLVNQKYVHFICFDYDKKDRLFFKELVKACLAAGVPLDCLLLEFSGRGYHLYIAFEKPAFAKDAVNLGKVIYTKLFPDVKLNEFHLRAAAASAKVELFPKQIQCIGSTLGNAIRIPLGYHTVTKEWSRLLDKQQCYKVRKSNEAAYNWRPMLLLELQKLTTLHAPTINRLDVTPLLEQPTTGSVSTKKDRPCMKLLLKGVKKGSRAMAGFYLSSYFYYACKLPAEQVEEQLMVWNEKNSPPLPERKLTECLERGTKYMPPSCTNTFLAGICFQVETCPYRKA